MSGRWDIEVRILDGPEASYRIQTFKGNEISIGSSPPPGGIQLSNAAISTVHTRITCSNGDAWIMPIEYNEVRVATHEHEDWSRLDPIYQPIPLHEGYVIYVGQLGHGSRFLFLKTKPFEWSTGNIIGANDGTKTIRVSKYPVWFFPTLAGMISLTLIVFVTRVLGFLAPEPPLIGPSLDGYDHYATIDIQEEVEPSILNGFQGPFEDFVMSVNHEERQAQGATDIADLSSNPDQWDSAFYQATLNSVKRISKWHEFWRILDKVKEDYATVVLALRDKKVDMPEVFAGIPFQETQYNPKLMSTVCAGGIWQFMPETANRMGLEVRECRLGLTGKTWSPQEKAPPYRVRTAKYLSVDADGKVSCRIGNSSAGSYCKVDERIDIAKSTAAAMALLKETFNDGSLAGSGSLVQATILAHNAGYNDSPYLNKIKYSNVLPAYQVYMKRKKKGNGIRFYGDNLCPDIEKDPESKCGSVLPAETQKYGYRIVAQHLLAVCYYAKHYGSFEAFAPYQQKYLNGYCKEVTIPDLK